MGKKTGAKKPSMEKRLAKELESFSAVVDLRSRFSDLANHLAAVRREVEDLHLLTNKLLDVGVAISSEIDLYSLLTRIIEEAKGLLKAEKGTLYLADREKHELYFHVTDEERLKEIRLPIDEKSISGYVAQSSTIINLPDVHRIGRDKPYKFNRAIDRKTGYRTKSVLTVPMLNHEGEVTGVVQLINKLEEGKVIEFTKRDERILMSLASQAAVSIENAQLYKEIAELFEAVVQFSASAIDERDPATAGHSRRVAMYSVAVARAMGAFSDDEIKELEYAAWLHDVGKIGVREHILLKENKLYPEQIGSVRGRFRAMAMLARQNRENLKAAGAAASKIKRFEAEEKSILEDLDFVENVNKTGFISDDDLKKLDEIAAKSMKGPGGEKIRFLEKAERDALAIRRGNLTNDERDHMSSHVVRTYRILKEIPFTRRLARVPKIAASHHERLDGSGYPKGVKGDGQSLQARIIALVDVFDALTAQDRPYKRAVPIDRSLKILEEEVKASRLDGEVFKVFVDNEIYKLTDADLERILRVRYNA